MNPGLFDSLTLPGPIFFGILLISLVASGGHGFLKPCWHTQIESVGGQGSLQRICMLFFQKGETWCSVLDDFRSHIRCSPFSFLGGQFSWHEDDGVSAVDVLSKPSSEQGSALEEAKAFLTATLLEGKCEAKKIYEDAKEGEGISKRTLDRAKKELRIKSKKEGDVWIWKLPEGKVAKGHIPEEDGNIDSLSTYSQKFPF